MPLCIVKRDNILTVERRLGNHADSCVAHIETINEEDIQFLTLDEDNKAFICQKKKSAWIKEQIKNAISE